MKYVSSFEIIPHMITITHKYLVIKTIIMRYVNYKHNIIVR